VVADTKEATAHFLRKDLGGGVCLHLDLRDGRAGFSFRDNVEDKPARPPHADRWVRNSAILPLYDGIRAVAKAKGLIGAEPPAAPGPIERSSSPFLRENLGPILSFRRGRLKKAPWWLRWLFHGVVTRERYGDH